MRSLDLFEKAAYLDAIQAVHPFEATPAAPLPDGVRRSLVAAHQGRRTAELFSLLRSLDKFAYEDPVWYLLRNVHGCFDRNPAQVKRIEAALYQLTSDEMLRRIETAPDLNRQTGPMFAKWLRRTFAMLPSGPFQASREGIWILDATEDDAMRLVGDLFDQDLRKRPHLVAKVNGTYVLGEAKWIGQPGGNQSKQVNEVLEFCRQQKGLVRRIGIVDGFPWAVRNASGAQISNKEAVLVQEAPFDVLSALLLQEYLESLR